MTGDTSLIVIVIILAVLVFLFSDSKKKSKPKYVVMKGAGCSSKRGKSYMSELEDVDDLASKESGSSYENFEDYILDNGLEKSVTESHNQYVQDLQQRTSGASVETVTSHDENINPWVGLRRPDYLSVKVDANAREVSSQTPEQLRDSSNKKRYGYF